MFGDPQRPQDLGLLRGGVGVGRFADRLGRHAGDLLGVVEGVGLDVGPVLLKALGRVGDEGRIVEAGGDDLPAHGVGQGDVGADVEPEPGVGESG